MPLAARALLALSLLAPFPAAAITGGVPAPASVAAQTAMIVSTRGAACSSAVLTRDLLLTAAHCVGPKADYAAVVFEPAGPRLIPVTRIALHPRYSAAAFAARKPTPDLALVLLADALPASFAPARLVREKFQPRAGDRFTLIGYGIATEGDEKSAGKPFRISLPAIGNTIDATGVIMVRLAAGGGKVAGACTGDSGGPVFRGNEVAAVIGWVSAARGRHCGTVTGATLVPQQLDWIEETARALGSSVGTDRQ